MSEEERQANISLGMKKRNMLQIILYQKIKKFLFGCNGIYSKAGKCRKDECRWKYGLRVKRKLFRHGSNLVYTTDGLDMMRSMDSGAYDEYQRISRESSNLIDSLTL